MIAVLRNQSSKEIVLVKDAVAVVIEVRFDGTIWFVCKHQNENENEYYNSDCYELMFPAPFDFV